MIFWNSGSQANSATTIPKLQLAPDVIAEIQAAVFRGKEVIVHQSNITAFGWTGAGYAVIDPLTGDGAWRISGGGNGTMFYAGLIFGASAVALSAGALPTILLIAPILASIVIFLTVILRSFDGSYDFLDHAVCFVSGLLSGIGLAFIGSPISLLIGFLGTKALPYLAFDFLLGGPSAIECAVGFFSYL